MKLNCVRVWAVVLVGLLAMCAGVRVGAGTTGIVAGFVRNAEDGTPLAGANVIISGTHLTTVTDPNGYFVITNVPPGDYEITAEMVGFAAEVVGDVQVTMDTTSTVDFDMRQEAIPETEAFVTRPRPMINTDVTSTLNLISSGQEELTRTDPLSVRAVSGVLSTFPGVVVDPSGSGQIHLRGGRADQVGYYIEGVPITDPNTGMFSNNLFTTGEGRFQMYPGNFGAEYGNAISGVLNEVKLTGPQSPGGKMDMESGNEQFRNAMIQFGGGTADMFNYYVGGALFRSEVDGPILTEQGYSDNAAKLVWPLEDDKVTVLALQGSMVGYMDSYHEVTNYLEPTPRERDYARQRYALGAVTLSHNFSTKSFADVTPYYILATGGANWLGDGSGIFWDSWSAQKGLLLRYTSQLNDRHLFKAGGSLLSSDNNFYTYAAPPPAPWSNIMHYQADVDTFQTALYAQDTMKLSDRWVLDAGLRLDRITYDRKGLEFDPVTVTYSGPPRPDPSESRITPRLGLCYAEDESTAWRMSWGKYTKFVPSSYVEMVYFDPAAELDAPGVGASDPQQSSSWEMSLEKQVSDTLSYRITPFYTKYQNLVQLSMIPPGVMAYTNMGEAESRGFELFARKRVSDNFQGWVSYTYQNSKGNSQGELSMVTDPTSGFYYTSWDQRHTLSLVAQYKAGRWAHNLRADYGTGLADYCEADLAAFQGRANPHLVVSYTATVDLPMDSSVGDNAYLSIYNLFNLHQTLQYRLTPDYVSGGVVRSRYAWVPSRFISFGVSRAF